MPPWLSGRAADRGSLFNQPCICNLPVVGSSPTGGSIISYSIIIRPILDLLIINRTAPLPIQK